MKSWIALSLALAALPAAANPKLAADRNCITCHEVDKDSLGPSFKQIAARYAGQKDAAPKLVQIVMKGTADVPPGTPKYKNYPMPPNPQVSEAEARQLVQWVLGLK